MHNCIIFGADIYAHQIMSETIYGLLKSQRIV